MLYFAGKLPKQTLTYCGNKSDIEIAHKQVFHERSKHIEIDDHLKRYQF